MKSYFKRSMILVLVAALVLAAAIFGQSRIGTPENPAIFSPAHLSMADAVRHFFGVRSEPTQPVAFVHRPHIEIAELECTDCHITAGRGPEASIPDVRTCWNCHEGMLTENPQIQIVRSYFEKGQDIPWQRVYGWVEEAHVRFNHAPHVRAEVECVTCHGDVAQMAVAERVVDHSMEFCVDCHKQREASLDCLACHY